MNAYTPREYLALMPASRTNAPASHHLPARRSASSVLGGLFSRVSAVMERRTVLAELNDMTDRELADIGLTRSEAKHVFDPSFARSRA